MQIRQPRYSNEEAARLGDEIYDRSIRSSVESGHADEIVAIDLDTGAWVIDPDERTAAKRLEATNPDAQIWVVRVGSRSVRRFGAGEKLPNAMMTGTVNSRLNAVLKLSIFDAFGGMHPVDVVIGTGYNGGLTLPPKQIAAWGLQWQRFGRATLANGVESVFSVFESSINWDGQSRVVDVDELDADPLAGMRLLLGYELNLPVYSRSTFTIQKIAVL